MRVSGIQNNEESVNISDAPRLYCMNKFDFKSKSIPINKKKVMVNE